MFVQAGRELDSWKLVWHGEVVAYAGRRRSYLTSGACGACHVDLACGKSSLYRPHRRCAHEIVNRYIDKIHRLPQTPLMNVKHDGELRDSCGVHWELIVAASRPCLRNKVVPSSLISNRSSHPRAMIRGRNWDSSSFW